MVVLERFRAKWKRVLHVGAPVMKGAPLRLVRRSMGARSCGCRTYGLGPVGTPKTRRAGGAFGGREIGAQVFSQA
jgi:hypothetical protein